MTPAEIGRTVSRIEAAMLALTQEVRSRHHEIANRVNDALAPISVLNERVSTLSSEVNTLKVTMGRIIWLAGSISGGISVAAYLLSRAFK